MKETQHKGLALRNERVDCAVEKRTGRTIDPCGQGKVKMHLSEATERARGILTLRAFEKVVYLVRHGQSLANTVHWEDDERMDPKFRDAPLTDKGHEQAKSLQSIVRDWNVQLVIASPLTRALQTACLAFEHETVPIVAWPTVTEFYPDLPECQGRQRDVLATCPLLTPLKRFSSIHLDNVNGDWWHVSGDMGRLDAILAWLRWAPETRVAIVCHWGLIFNLMKHCHYPQTINLDNCSYLRTTWLPSPTITPKATELAVRLVPDTATSCPFLDEIHQFFTACTKDAELSSASILAERDPMLHITLCDFTTVESSKLQNHIQTLGDALRAAALSCVNEQRIWRVDANAISVEVDQGKTLYARLSFPSAGLDAITRRISDRLHWMKGAAAIRKAPYSATLLLDNQPTAVTRTLKDFEKILRNGNYPLLSSCLTVHQDDSTPINFEWREQFAGLRWKLVAVTRDAEGEVRREPGFVFPLY